MVNLMHMIRLYVESIDDWNDKKDIVIVWQTHSCILDKTFNNCQGCGQFRMERLIFIHC